MGLAGLCAALFGVVPGMERSGMGHVKLQKCKKALKPQASVLFGGDKRDRTADLLNAIDCRKIGNQKALAPNRKLLK